jgi:hypothetical protein
MVIGRGGNWAICLGGEMAKGRIGYGQNGEKIGRNGKWAKWHWAKWEYTNGLNGHSRPLLWGYQAETTFCSHNIHYKYASHTV